MCKRVIMLSLIEKRSAQIYSHTYAHICIYLCVHRHEAQKMTELQFIINVETNTFGNNNNVTITKNNVFNSYIPIFSQLCFLQPQLTPLEL